MADQTIKTKVELEGSEQAAAKSKALREELEKLSKAATAVLGSNSGLYSPKSLGSQPELVNALKNNAKVMAALQGSQGNAKIPKVNAPPVIGASSSSPSGHGPSKSPILNPLGLTGILGSLFEAFTRLRIALFTLQPVFRAFGVAIAQITSAVTETANLYIKAAQLGRDPGQLFGMQKAAQATGMSPEQLQSFMLRFVKSGAPSKEQGNFNDRARLRGLEREALEMYEAFAHLDKQMSEVTGKLYNVQFAATKAVGEWEAFRALLVGGMSGALVNLMDMFKAFAQSMNELGISASLGKLLGEVLINVNKSIELILVSARGLVTAFKLIDDSIAYLMAKVYNLMNPTSKVDTSVLENDMKIGALKIGEMVKNLFIKGWNPEDKGRDGNRIAPAAAPILPAGHWEKLGLSLGASSATDFAKQTAENTKAMVGLLKAAVNKSDFSLDYYPQNAP